MVAIYKCPKCKKQYRLYSLKDEEGEVKIIDFLCYKCENPYEFVYSDDGKDLYRRIKSINTAVKKKDERLNKYSSSY